MNKVFIKFFGLLSLIMLCIGVCSCSSNSKGSNEDLADNQELVNSIIELAIEESDVRLDDYLDVDYFVNLQYSTEELVESIQKLSISYENNEESSIDLMQYESLAESVTGIIDDLSEEEYQILEQFAEEDNEISEFLELIENEFEVNETDNVKTSLRSATSNIVKLSTGILEIGSILAAQKVCQAAIVTIKAAFNSMIASLKAFFVPNVVKGIIITAAILVITTVVIINWNKIKPVFTKIANVFINNAKKFASAVANVFNSIYTRGVSSEATAVNNAVFDNNIKSQMGRYGLTSATIISLIKEFSNVDINKSNNENRTIYLGVIESGYNQIASNRGGISFHVSDNRWNALVEKYGTAGLWLVNRAFLNYVVYKRWEIVLVTNPREHYDLLLQKKLTNRMYASELEYLCKFKGATWHYEGPYWRIDKAW